MTIIKFIKSYLAFTGLFGLYFGGGGGSADNQTETTTTNTDNRMVVDNGSLAIGAGASGNTINMTDSGAIQAAFDFATGSNAIAGENYKNLLDTTSSSLNGILNGIASTQNFIAATAADAKGAMDNKTILTLGGGVLAVLAVGMMIRRKA